MHTHIIIITTKSCNPTNHPFNKSPNQDPQQQHNQKTQMPHGFRPNNNHNQGITLSQNVNQSVNI